MVLTTMRVRYQRSLLGFAWTLVHPLLMLSVLSLVFSELLHVGIDRFPVYLFAGLLPWQVFSQAVQEGSRSLLEREGVIRRLPVPIALFPLSTTLVAITHGVIAMGALSILLPMFGYAPSVHLLLLPAAGVILAVFALGVTLVTMTLVTYFRDVDHFVSVGLQAAYFASPILYTPELVPRLAPLLDANPMRWILSLFQHAIYDQSWPAGEVWGWSIVSALGALLIGLLVYKRCEHDYVFRL